MMGLFKKKEQALPPKRWSDITIADHKRIVEVYDKHRDDPDDPILPYELVCAVYGKPWSWIEKMDLSEANEYVATLEFLGERPKPRTAKAGYTINGHKYKTTFNMQRINTAQYIDFQQLYDKSGEMPAEFLAIILIPEGKEYNEGYNIDDVVSDIEYHFPIEDALGLSAFFFTLLQISIRRSVRNLKKLIRKAKKEGKMTREQLDALRRVVEITESGNGSRR